MEVDDTFDSLVKKEKLGLLKEREKLERNLDGIKNIVLLQIKDQLRLVKNMKSTKK